MSVGIDVRIDETARLKGPHEIGNHVSIDYGTYCTVQLRIADYVHIGPHVSIIGGASATFSMGNFSFLAAGCRVICASDEHLGEGIGIPWIPKGRDRVVERPITVADFAGVCTGAILMPGVTIAEGAIIGAGCIVRKSVDPWMVYIPGMAGEPMPVKVRPQDKIKATAKELGYDISP